MKKFYTFFVFLSLAFILISVPNVTASSGKSTSSGQLTLQIGASNRSTVSTSENVQVPPNQKTSNSVQLQVGKLEEIDLVGMQGETITRTFNLMLSAESFEVFIKKENFDLNSSLLTIQPEEFVLSQDSQQLRMKLEIPESTEPGEYGGTVKILRKSNGERIGELKINIRILKRLVEPLKFQEPRVQQGGIFYRWYRTLPNAKIKIGSDLLDNSQPDGSGHFYLRVNTSLLQSRFGWTNPRQIYRVNITLDGVIKKNGEAEKVNDGLGFTLTILPRKHITRWSLERKKSAGGAILASMKTGERTKFTAEYNTKNLLRLIKEKETGMTTRVGGSLFSAQIGPVSANLLGAGASGQLSHLSGVSSKADYDKNNTKARVEAGLHILNGMLSKLNPVGGKVLTSLLNRPQYLQQEYQSSGFRLQTAGGANILKADLKLGEDTEARVARFQVGGHGERTGSYLYTNYSNKPLESHSFTTSQSYGAGVSGQLLGNNLLNIKLGDSSKTELRFDNRTAREGITADLAVVSSDKRSIYHLGKVGGEKIYEDTLQRIGSSGFILHSSRAWFKDLKELLLQERQLNKSVRKNQGESVGLQVPVKLEIAGTGVFLSEGASFRRSNEFLSERYRVIRRGEELPLKLYSPRDFEPVQNLFELISYSLQPINLTDLLYVTTQSLQNGKLTFPDGVLETGRSSGNFTIKTFPPSNLSTRQVTSDYLLSLSGSGFARSNVTEIQPVNFSNFQGNITLDYVPGGDEESYEIYRWSSTQSSWTSTGGTVGEEGNEVSSEIDRPGSYVVGVDKTAPEIEGEIPTAFGNNLTFSLQVSDNGTGVNGSSIEVSAGEEQLNFTYSPSSGVLSVNQDLSPGDYNLTIDVRDTSGNSNSFQKEVTVVKPPKVSNFTVELSGNELLLNWTPENGTYPIDHFLLSRDGDLMANTTATYNTTRNTNSSLFAVFPVDTEGFIGSGGTYLFSRPKIISDFKWDWNRTLRPAVGVPITFNASPTKVLNGTFSTKIDAYRWEFVNETGDLVAQKSGEFVRYAFTSPGKYEVTLNVTDDAGQSSFITQDIVIEDVETNETAEKNINISLDSERTHLSATPGSILQYEIILENKGSGKDLINLSRIDSPWPWALLQDGTKVQVPFPSENLSQHLLPPGKGENLTLLVRVPKSGSKEVSLKLQARSWVDSTINDDLLLFASRLKGGVEDSLKDGDSDGGGGGGGAAPSFSKSFLNEPTQGTSKNESSQDSKVQRETGKDQVKKNGSKVKRNTTKSTEVKTPTGHFLDSSLPFLVAGIVSLLLGILLLKRLYI